MLLTMSWSLKNVKEVRVGQLKNLKEAPGTADLIFALGENNLCLTETQDPSRTIDVWSGKNILRNQNLLRKRSITVRATRQMIMSNQLKQKLQDKKWIKDFPPHVFTRNLDSMKSKIN